MSNCSNPGRHAAKDSKAMGQVDAFLEEHPEAGYAEVAAAITWYFDDPDCSPWIADWIVALILDKRRESR